MRPFARQVSLLLIAILSAMLIYIFLKNHNASLSPWIANWTPFILFVALVSLVASYGQRAQVGQTAATEGAATAAPAGARDGAAPGSPPRARLDRSLACVQADQDDDGAGDFDEAVRIKPDHAAASGRHGRAYGAGTQRGLQLWRLIGQWLSVRPPSPSVAA